MKEQKYRLLVDYRSFKKGELVVRVKGMQDNNASEAYCNGKCSYYLSDFQIELVIDEPISITTEDKLSSYEKEVNVVNPFKVGSKWVAKCNITSARYGTGVDIINKGTVLEVISVIGIGENKVLTLIDNRFLTYSEAQILLEPYVEPSREMTAEQIAKEFNVKVVE